MQKKESAKQKEENLFVYERSRFHSGVSGVIFSSILIAGLGVFMWPVLRDMNGHWGEVFRSAALILGAVLLVISLVGLYFLARLISSFRYYVRGLRTRQHTIVPTLIAFVVAVGFILMAPIIIFVLNPIL